MTESFNRKLGRLAQNVSGTGSITTNASTASAWQTARTITLGGDLSGSVSLDGSSNVSLTATVAGNTVALGTDTTGNYVATVAAGSGISVTGSGTETAAVTVSIDNTVATLTGSQTLTNKTINVAAATGNVFQIEGNTINSYVGSGANVVLSSSPTITNLYIPGSGMYFNGSTSGLTNVQATAVAGNTTLTLPAANDTLVGRATTDTLTNKTISGADNTLSNIGNSSLSNSGITINGTSVSLGGTRTLVTDDIAEDGSPVNLWYTDARARSAISITDAGGDGSLSYVSGTGVITYTGPSATEVRAHFSAGTGVTITSGQIAIGQAVGTSDNVTFAGVTADAVRIGVTAAGEIDTTAGNLTLDSTGGTTTIDDDATVTGNLQVDGNLTVSGTTVTINATNLAVEDNMIYLNNGSTVSHPDLGFAGNYNDGTYRHAGVFRDATDGVWKFFHQYTLEPDASAFIDTAHGSFALAPIQASSFTGSVTGNVTGNASTATKWQTARTLSLTGDVTGTSAAFDGSGNISITTTIAADSVALGTDTTGNYVASITNGNYITGGNGGSEGAALTLAVDATSANTASKVVARDASGNFSAGTITANLSGNASTVTNGVYTTDTGTVTNTMLAGSIANNKLANSTISGISLGSNLATLTLGVSGTGLSGSQTYNGSGAATFTVTSNATSANTGSTIVARDASGNFTAGTITAALSGNATTATTLQTARNINGVSFNGSADITVADSTKLPLAGGTLTGNLTTRSTLPGYSGSVYFWNGSALQYYWTKIANISSVGDSHASILITTKTDVNYMPFSMALLSLSAWNGTTQSVKLDAINSQDMNILVRVDNNGDVWLQADGAWSSYKTWRVLSLYGSPTIYSSPFTETLTTPPNSVQIAVGQQIRGNQGSIASATVANVSSLIVGSLNSRGDVYTGGNLVLHAGNYSSYALPISGGSLTGNLQFGANLLQFDQSGTRSWSVRATGGNLDVASGDGNGAFRYNGSTIWTSGNDGAGSGLDADLLDGQQGTYYAAASSLSSYLPLSGGTATSVTLGVRSNTNTFGGNTTGLSGYSFPGEIRANGAKPALTWHYENVATRHIALEASGALNVLNPGEAGGAVLQVGGNTVLHAGNYTSYVNYGNPSTRGVYQISNWNQTTYPNTHFLSSENNTTNAPTTDFTYGLQYSFHRDGAAYRTQMVTALYSNLSIYVRNSRDGDAWTSWKELLHSGNYNSYSPTLAGGNASGTWGISISGNAATATSATSAGTLSNNASITGLNFSGTFALVGSGASTGNSTGTRFSENYGVLWNMADSATWHHQVINGSMLCGFLASGTNWGSGKVVASSDMRATIFYDYNDTGYYIDPNSTSNSALRVRGGALFGPNTSWSAYLYVGTNGRPDSNASVCATNGNLHIDCANGYAMYLNYYSNNNIYTFGNMGIGSDSAGYRLQVHGTGYATSDFRAPIFYDSNDTGYYVDPTSFTELYGGIRNTGNHYTSQIINRLPAANNGAGTGIVQLQMWCSEPGITWDSAGFGYNVTNDGGSPNGFGRINASFGQAYMRFNSNGSLIFYNTNTSGTRYNNLELYADNTVYVNNFATAGNSFRAPIFYDSNDTNWYCNPNSTSRFYRLNLEDRLYIYGGNPGDPGSDVTPQVFFKTGGGMGLSSIETDFWTGFTGSSYPSNFQIGFRMAYDKRLYVWQDVVQNYSDERLKEKTGTLAGALDAIKSWTPFKYVDNALANSFNFGSGRTQIGLSAQEVEAFYPELVELAPFDAQSDFSDETNPRRVSKSGENYLTLNYTRLVPVLVQAIKEQQQEIEALKKHIRDSQ